MQEHLFNTLFANQTPSILILISATLFIAGIVKGFLGIGLPAAAMGLLTLLPCLLSRFYSPILLNL